MSIARRAGSLTVVVAAALAVACHHAPPVDSIAVPAAAAPQSQAERMVALLPDGAQIVIEVDLARLRANPTVGGVVTQALAALGADARLPGLPVAVAGSPLANADVVVLAAYGVGTVQATTLTLLATKSDVSGGVRLAPDIVAIGPDEWTGQLATRAALAADHPLALSAELASLRAHAEPKGASGAVLRVTARLSFDARVALARLTGLDAAPARISVWADVADDLAIVVDADAVDPGDQAAKDAAKRMASTFRGLFRALGDAQPLRGLGVGPALADARLIADGTWVRAIVAVGPRHLARAADRARAMLGGDAGSAAAPATASPATASPATP